MDEASDISNTMHNPIKQPFSLPRNEPAETNGHVAVVVPVPVNLRVLCQTEADCDANDEHWESSFTVLLSITGIDDYYHVLRPPFTRLYHQEGGGAYSLTVCCWDNISLHVFNFVPLIH